MKTIKEWLEELEEPYRTQAIENTNEVLLTSKEDCLSDAIYSAFAWSLSPEGTQYWIDLKNEIVKTESK